MIAEIVGFLSSQAWAIAQFVPSVATFRREQSKTQNDAIGAMREALIYTLVFIKKPDFTDKKELLKISNLWNVASTKVGVIDPYLGKTLGDKSRFWGDLKLFRRVGKDKDIMSLERVTDEIERIYLKIK